MAPNYSNITSATCSFLALLIAGDVAVAESALVASLDMPDAEMPAGHAVGLDETNGLSRK